MAAIRNLRLNLFQDDDSSRLIIHASYTLTFDVFEVIDEHVYAELLTLFDEAESNENSDQIVLDFGNIKAASATIDRDVDIVVPKHLFKNLDVSGSFEKLNGKISIQNLPDVQIVSYPTPEVEGFVLN